MTTTLSEYTSVVEKGAFVWPTNGTMGRFFPLPVYGNKIVAKSKSEKEYANKLDAFEDLMNGGIKILDEDDEYDESDAPAIEKKKGTLIFKSLTAWEAEINAMPKADVGGEDIRRWLVDRYAFVPDGASVTDAFPPPNIWCEIYGVTHYLYVGAYMEGEGVLGDGTTITCCFLPFSTVESDCEYLFEHDDYDFKDIVTWKQYSLNMVNTND